MKRKRRKNKKEVKSDCTNEVRGEQKKLEERQMERGKQMNKGGIQNKKIKKNVDGWMVGEVETGDG